MALLCCNNLWLVMSSPATMMIQNSTFDQTQGIAQPSRDQLVDLRRFCDSARMRVGEDHGGGPAKRWESIVLTSALIEFR
jgi:hypothetical protein